MRKYIAANSVSHGFFPDIVIAELAGTAVVFVFLYGFTIHNIDIAILGAWPQGQHGQQAKGFSCMPRQINPGIPGEAGWGV